jgi:hypothetical protein
VKRKSGSHLWLGIDRDGSVMVMGDLLGDVQAQAVAGNAAVCSS